MFPEAYIALCRELNLSRPAQTGDYFHDEIIGASGVMTNGSGLCYLSGGFVAMVHGRVHDQMVWLPREGDWLDLLEAEGCDAMVYRWGDGYKAEPIPMGEFTSTYVTPEVADRLIALAHLYAAVTGKGKA